MAQYLSQVLERLRASGASLAYFAASSSTAPFAAGPTSRGISLTAAETWSGRSAARASTRTRSLAASAARKAGAASGAARRR
jgi:hypothetical protein